jgi:hypothetical protein
LTRFEAVLAELLVKIMAVDPSATGGEGNYTHRNGLIWLALRYAFMCEYPCGVKVDQAEPDYPVVAYIVLPNLGQVSWHLPAFPEPYDGHSDIDKGARIIAYFDRTRGVYG